MSNIKSIRSLIRDALSQQDEVDGETLKNYVSEMSKGEYNNRAIGQSVRWMISQGKVKEVRRDVFALPGRENPKGMTLVQSNREGETVQLAPFQQRRAGRLVSIEHSPIELEDVARISLQRGGSWFPVPLFGDVRICIGPEVPRYSPEQETYNGITALKVITKEGKAQEMNIDPRNPITVAPR